MRYLVVPFWLSVAAASPLLGQVPFEACRDRDGRLIPGIVDNTLTYAGRAGHRAGRPVILWNAKVNRHLSDTEQIYIYLHECAHHLLGHLEQRAYDVRWEIEADCWAIQLMVDGGMIRGRHFRELERSRRTVRGDGTHLGGEAHVRSLRECLALRIDQKAWASALDTMLLASDDGFAGARGRLLDSLGGLMVHRSLLGTPGTYDCEVVGAAVRCMLFASRKPGPAVDRYRRLVRLVRGWLPPGWSAIERRAADGAAHAFLAQDGLSGTLLTLAQNGARVHFLMKRMGEAATSR